MAWRFYMIDAVAKTRKTLEQRALFEGSWLIVSAFEIAAIAGATRKHRNAQANLGSAMIAPASCYIVP